MELIGDEKNMDEVVGEGEVNLLQPPSEVLKSFIKKLWRNSEKNSEWKLKIIADKDALREAMEEFIVASATKQLQKKEKLDFLSVDSAERRSLAIVDDKIVGFVELKGSLGTLTSTDSDLHEQSLDLFDSLWSQGKSYNIRTPPISEVRKRLKDEIGEKMEDDFYEALKTGADGVKAALIAAAKNEVLLYDVSKWGEDTGVASKATFSRKKAELEDKGIIQTEEVPVDIGRPRLRLKLGENAKQTEIQNIAKKIV